MKQVPIPHSQLSVSALCYGAGSFGTRTSNSDAERLYSLFRANGGNFFDTAHCYAFWEEDGLGISEKLLGACIRQAGDRDGVVIATKGGHPEVAPQYPRPDQYLAPELIASDLGESLERLGVDTVDLYFLHRDDPRVPVAEIIDALNREIVAGRIQYLGASNWSVERIEAANRDAASRGLQGFVASQPQWSLAEPNWRPEAEPTMRFVTEPDRAWHAVHSVAVVPYSATANGYFATHGERGGSYQNPMNEARLQRAEQLAAKIGCTPNQIALGYLMNQGFPVIPIFGTTNPEHLADAMGADAVSLTAAQVTWLREG